MNGAKSGLMHTLLNDIGDTRNDHRNSGSPLLELGEQGHDLVPVVKGTLNNGSVRHTGQDIIHGGIVNVAGFHVPQVYRSMLVTDAQKVLGPGCGADLVDTGGRATQYYKIILEAFIIPSAMQTMSHESSPLITVKIEGRQSQPQVVFTVDGIPES